MVDLNRRELFTFAAIGAAMAVSPVLAQGGPGQGQGLGQGQGRGLGPGQGQGPMPGVDPARQQACRDQAAAKGLVGPAKREERQAFMQKCVHGN